MEKLIKKINVAINKILEPKIKLPLHPLRDGTESIGTEYGAWIIPKGFLNEKSIYYGVGAGLDISFDIGLVQKYACETHIFDPTPRSIEHFELLKENTRLGKPTSTNNAGPRYEVTIDDLVNINFHPLGVWNEDTQLKFYTPAEEKFISHSIVNLQKTEKFFEAKVQRLSTIMSELGHTKIDLLKLDIEGAEYQVIRDLLQEQLAVDVLCVEFDETARNHLDRKYIQRIQQTLDDLQAGGYLAVCRDEDFNFTFMHERLYKLFA